MTILKDIFARCCADGATEQKERSSELPMPLDVVALDTSGLPDFWLIGKITTDIHRAFFIPPTVLRKRNALDVTNALD